MTVLVWQDYAVILTYLAGMLVFGAYLARRKQNDEEYFLGGRRMPWLAVGVSVIASLLSSLTYLSEPGEVWNSGATHMAGKMLAIPFEIVIVWLFCVPFMMRFRFTSAYEYLEHRFNLATRRLGAALFVAMVVLWMGFVVLASSRALAELSRTPLWLVIAAVGVVATIYTTLGGLRAVIWTDVVQVALLVGGGLFAIGYVAYATGSFLPEWIGATRAHLAANQQAERIPWFSLDPTMRVTVVTVALNMTVWHVCTHTANQMTVQRYYSTRDMRAARRSFLTGALLGAGLNIMLMVVGMAMVFFYFGQGLSPDGGLDPLNRQERDLIFPAFAVARLTPGLGGAILAALLAAAVSSIDSGINSIATVVSREVHRREGAARASAANHVLEARVITLAAGSFITVAAYQLSYLPTEWGIVDAMPRTFNAITGPLGGLFLMGMFLPFVRGRAAFVATITGLGVAVVLGYWKQIGEQFVAWGWLETAPRALSFTLVMPTAVLAVFATAAVLSIIDTAPKRDLSGLTWYSRNRPAKNVELDGV
ncbi:MAG: sodium/solute symporter [Planctomycetes bacterium]|nr:sodium/solute symporter [Planctomycetota bacterium]